MTAHAIPARAGALRAVTWCVETGASGLEAVQQRLRARQRRRKRHLWLVGIPLALATLVVRTAWLAEGPVDDLIEGAGVALILLGGLGRAWSILYIGGRKTRELVSEGPYSLTRNPLYLFTLVAAVGLGLQVGSLAMGLIYLLGTLLVFLPVIVAEEQALAERFGPAFLAYRREVPRLVPRLLRPSRWKDADAFCAAPPQLYRSLRDSALLVASVPLFQGVEWLQANHVLPVLLHLP